MPSSLSTRRFTDSLASIALTVKCLPTSRMNSIAPSFVSHSALLTSRAGAARALEIEEARELRADPATLASTCSSVSSVRSAALKLGSPISPVPPPTSAIGE